MQVATQILEQLGGHRFTAMTGAKQFVGSERALQFSIGRGATNKANKVRVTLATDDTYTVEFFNLRGVNCKPCGEPVERVYADRLQAVFTEATGLDTWVIPSLEMLLPESRDPALAVRMSRP